jgi:hypothetical protein
LFDDIEKLIRQAANGALQDKGAALQRAVDRVRRQNKGRPASTVKAALRRALTAEGVPVPSDRWLADRAAEISTGARIKVTVEKLR